jgi:serine protease AprX
MAKSTTKKSAGKKRTTKSKPPAEANAPPKSAQAPDENDRSFNPDVLESTIIARPLFDKLQKDGLAAPQDIIIDVNRDYPGGRDKAQAQIRQLIVELVKAHGLRGQGVHGRKTDLTRQYVFGRLRGDLIQELVRKDRELAREEARKPALYRVWPDFEVRTLTERSVATVKADAARNAFGAVGRNILWAVVDSGIDGGHPHFRKHENLKLDPPLRHCDFSSFGEIDEEESERAALTDEKGHGTHVAGIIAGALEAGQDVTITATVKNKDEQGKISEEERSIDAISGMAPACKLISFKVLDKNGKGPVSNLIAVCEHIQEINGNGRYIRIHGVNMSVGYDFEPSWFACGQSPLCVEIDRLVRTGVVVVVAAGNTGYGWNQSAFRGAAPAGMDLTINDPGNADLAITVGSTHRDMPHVYGVSYFSSKGPTGDGRLKPDLVAPGEKIISCQAGASMPAAGGGSIGAAEVRPNAITARYKEDSGTSMAAPHVSGVIAAFLSIRHEFIGRPERVKEIFLATATDLRRDRYFQGSGLVDLMRAIQSV